MCPSCATCICALVLVPATAQNMVGEQTLRTTTPPASGCGVYGVCVSIETMSTTSTSHHPPHPRDEIRCSVSSGGTVSSTSCIHSSTLHSSMHLRCSCLYTVVLLVHGIGLPNTDRGMESSIVWRVAILDLYPHMAFRSMSGMTMWWSIG